MFLLHPSLRPLPRHPQGSPSSSAFGSSGGAPINNNNNHHDPLQANYNTKPKPFAPGGGAGGVPVAVNKQYNSPLNMYSVDNVMDSLSGQAQAMNIGGGYVAIRFKFEFELNNAQIKKEL